MKKKIGAIPKGFRTITPYLLLKDVAGLIKYLQKAFGAKVIDRMEGPGGVVMHACLSIGDSRIMLGEAHGKWKPIRSMIYLYVKSADATYRQALEAGGKSLMAPEDQFWGDRHGGVQDKWGNQWWMSTHIENVSPTEVNRRGREWMKQKRK